MSTTSNTTSGVSPGFLLFIVFLVLKLTHVIDWSWWWVTAPLWIPWLVVLAIVIVVAIVGFFSVPKYRRRF